MSSKYASKFFHMKSLQRQEGATLFTALVFLALMTIVSVSAAKIATLDAIVAGNNQQRVLVYQQTAKTLNSFTNGVKHYLQEQMTSLLRMLIVR